MAPPPIEIMQLELFLIMLLKLPVKLNKFSKNNFSFLCLIKFNEFFLSFCFMNILSFLRVFKSLILENILSRKTFDVCSKVIFLMQIFFKDL